MSETADALREELRGYERSKNADRAKQVRDQLKANCTQALRKQEKPLVADRTWTKGGDCEILDTDDDIEAAVIYTNESQDRKFRDADDLEASQRAQHSSNQNPSEARG